MSPSSSARAVLGGLAAVHLWWGSWAYVAPADFFARFPGFGHRWTAAYPPYNEHLIADLGATFLTLGVLLAIAAAVADRRVTRVVLTGVVLFSALHLVFHSRHAGLLGGSEWVLSLVTLVLGVLVPGALLGVTWTRRFSTDS
ncbi:hypothetical protein F4553_005999 [Allocatelliglobosispora scoriae]|uniref:Uncharacterized protein n=1 Tax=Allocatelliglobosispora scoriae TaxID=643052 RepID=A0A841BY24_9ACTN|nr:hypothetical protein [Allocatelliglobosispora scoriae]MBB5872565.1 hypothetical protein [Allocatelliglobosispora scoriae]